MTHTKGPWFVGPVDDTVVTHMGKDGIRYEVAAVDGDYNDPDTWPIMEANARLIAAAPDLLEFAKAQEAWEADMIINGDWSNEMPRLTQAQYDRMIELQEVRRAAISKAKGAE